MKKKMIGLLGALLLAMATGTVACLTAESMMLDTSTYHAPVDPSLVRVYLDVNDIPGEYVKIAVVKADSPAITDSSDNQMIWQMKVEAGRLGANGIILTVQNSQNMGLLVGTQKNWECIAIFIKD
jgi:hypothetical protein